MLSHFRKELYARTNNDSVIYKVGQHCMINFNLLSKRMVFFFDSCSFSVSLIVLSSQSDYSIFHAVSCPYTIDVDLLLVQYPEYKKKSFKVQGLP